MLGFDPKANVGGSIEPRVSGASASGSGASAFTDGGDDGLLSGATTKLGSESATAFPIEPSATDSSPHDSIPPYAQAGLRETPTDGQSKNDLDLGDLDWDLPDDFDDLGGIDVRAETPRPEPVAEDPAASTRVVPTEPVRVRRDPPGNAVRMTAFGMPAAGLAVDDVLSGSDGLARREAQLRITQSGDLPAVLAANDHRDNASSNNASSNSAPSQRDSDAQSSDDPLDDVLDVGFDDVFSEDGGSDITADIPAVDVPLPSSGFDQLGSADLQSVDSDPRGLDAVERSALDVERAALDVESPDGAKASIRSAAATPLVDIARSNRPTPIILSPVVAARRPTPKQTPALVEEVADAAPEPLPAESSSSTLWIALTGIGMLLLLAIFLLLR